MAGPSTRSSTRAVATATASSSDSPRAGDKHKRSAEAAAGEDEVDQAGPVAAGDDDGDVGDGEGSDGGQEQEEAEEDLEAEETAETVHAEAESLISTFLPAALTSHDLLSVASVFTNQEMVAELLSQAYAAEATSDKDREAVKKELEAKRAEFGTAARRNRYASLKREETKRARKAAEQDSTLQAPGAPKKRPDRQGKKVATNTTQDASLSKKQGKQPVRQPAPQTAENQAAPRDQDTTTQQAPQSALQAAANRLTTQGQEAVDQQAPEASATQNTPLQIREATWKDLRDYTAEEMRDLREEAGLESLESIEARNKAKKEADRKAYDRPESEAFRALMYREDGSSRSVTSDDEE
ncbi:uncharacterized protein LTR77_007131 [Saxophila tyrrhenica]|uniref:CUE domain-containing protein n=1 Tax=Saxophila tyrrhenica TaxID=1690608 RepID=A0AAV9P7N2_9PEZI|nr:hypothetical protein LTR77_007131 [Saxophila tyrrhenica]